jgi:hypothetical protein
MKFRISTFTMGSTFPENTELLNSQNAFQESDFSNRYSLKTKVFSRAVQAQGLLRISEG